MEGGHHPYLYSLVSDMSVFLFIHHWFSSIWFWFHSFVVFLVCYMSAELDGSLGLYISSYLKEFQPWLLWKFFCLPPSLFPGPPIIRMLDHSILPKGKMLVCFVFWPQQALHCSPIPGCPGANPAPVSSQEPEGTSGTMGSQAHCLLCP